MNPLALLLGWLLGVAGSEALVYGLNIQSLVAAFFIGFFVTMLTTVVAIAALD